MTLSKKIIITILLGLNILASAYGIFWVWQDRKSRNYVIYKPTGTFIAQSSQDITNKILPQAIPSAYPDAYTFTSSRNQVRTLKETKGTSGLHIEEEVIHTISMGCSPPPIEDGEELPPDPKQSKRS